VTGPSGDWRARVGPSAPTCPYRAKVSVHEPAEAISARFWSNMDIADRAVEVSCSVHVGPAELHERASELIRTWSG